MDPARSLQSEKLGICSNERWEDSRTTRYRQEVGLLVSEFWEDETSEEPNDNDIKCNGSQEEIVVPTRFVARYLRLQSETSSSTALITSEKGERNGFRPRHPGFVPVSLLEESSAPALEPKGSQVQGCFIPTCNTCLGPLQSGAFESQTRLVSVDRSRHRTPAVHTESTAAGIPNVHTATTDPRITKPQKSTTQKRRERRKRKELEDKYQKQKKKQQINNEPPLSKWYQHVLQQQQQQQQKEGKVLMPANIHQLHVTCGTCHETNIVNIPRRFKQKNAKDKTKEETPTKALVPSLPSKKMPDGLVPKNSTKRKQSTKDDSDPQNKNGSQDLGDDDFIPLMTSAVKPKKQRKKKESSNLLKDFLSSLNP